MLHAAALRPDRRRLPRLLLAASLACVALLALAGTASARSYFWLMPDHTYQEAWGTSAFWGKAVAPQGHARGKGVPIRTEDLAFLGGQHWFQRDTHIHVPGAQVVQLENRHSHRCIHHAYWDDVPGRELVQDDCVRSRFANLWIKRHVRTRWNGVVSTLQSLESDLFMNVAGAATWSGASLIQWPGSSAPNARFVLVYAGQT